MPKFKRDEFFQGAAFLKPEDVKDGQIFTIEAFESVTTKIGPRPLLRLKGVEVPLGLNATNSDIMCDIHGEDTDDWEGKKIKLSKIKVNNPQTKKMQDGFLIEKVGR